MPIRRRMQPLERMQPISQMERRMQPMKDQLFKQIRRRGFWRLLTPTREGNAQVDEVAPQTGIVTVGATLKRNNSQCKGEGFVGHVNRIPLGKGIAGLETVDQHLEDLGRSAFHVRQPRANGRNALKSNIGSSQILSPQENTSQEKRQKIGGSTLVSRLKRCPGNRNQGSQYKRVRKAVSWQTVGFLAPAELQR
jgi:hypothetical protein